jgi:hypothetical protein
MKSVKKKSQKKSESKETDINKDEVKKKLQEKYLDVYNKEKKLLNVIRDFGNPIKYLEKTLDHQRRLVSQFYNHLAAVYVNQIVSIDVILDVWYKSDLRIIEDIIIPMDEVLYAREHPGEKTPSFSILKQLCDGVKNSPEKERGQSTH